MHRNSFLLTLFLSVALSAVADNAAVLQWQSSLLPPADNKCQAIGYDIRTNDEGDAFLLANYGSINAADETTFFDRTLTGAEYGTGNGYNPNMVFAKVDSLGNPLWMIHSSEGYFAGGTCCPTRDGGAVLAVKFRLTEKNKQPGTTAPYMTLVDAANKTHSLSATFRDVNFHHIILVRVDAQGLVTQVTPVWTSQAVPAKGDKPAHDVADITAVMEGGNGDLYFQGGQAMDIALGTDTVRARSNPDWDGNDFSEHCNSFIIRTDAHFRHLAHTTTSGNLLYDRFMLSAHRDGTLMVVGHAKADSLGGTLRWGEQQAAIRDRCIIIARLNSDLTCTHLNALQQVRLGSLGGMCKQLAWSPDGTCLYMSGAVIGGLVLNGDTLRGGSDCQGKFNDGVLLQIDANTAAVTNAALRHGKLLNINIGTVSLRDTLYTLNYAFGDIHLTCYDSRLNPVGTIPLAQGGGSSNATGLALYGRNMWLGTRAHGGADFIIGNQTIKPAPLWYATLSCWQLGGGITAGMQSLSVTTPDRAQKVIIDGKLYIRRGSQLFNALGQPL